MNSYITYCAAEKIRRHEIGDATPCECPKPKLETVGQKWDEYTKGIGTTPALKELEEKWGTKWRSYKQGDAVWHDCKMIYRYPSPIPISHPYLPSHPYPIPIPSLSHPYPIPRTPPSQREEDDDEVQLSDIQRLVHYLHTDQMLSYLVNLPVRALASAALMDHKDLEHVEVTHLLGLFLGEGEVADVLKEAVTDFIPPLIAQEDLVTTAWEECASTSQAKEDRLFCARGNMKAYFVIAQVFLCVSAARPRDPVKKTIIEHSPIIAEVAKERNLLFRRASFGREPFQKLAAHIRANEEAELKLGAVPGKAGPGQQAARAAASAAKESTASIVSVSTPCGGSGGGASTARGRIGSVDGERAAGVRTKAKEWVARVGRRQAVSH